METIILTTVLLINNIICILIGAKIMQKSQKDEDIKLPSANPLQIYKEHESKVHADMERDKLNIINQNLESYDGTGNNQQDVPR